MKYAIVIPDGCADEPQESLGGQTPLQAAHTPAMDAIAAAGIVGRANHVPAHLPPGSDVANLSLLGYDPEVHFTGRAPLEAAAQGIPLGADDWAIRCNLVTIERQVMREFTAGHISTAEARELLCEAQARLGAADRQFIAGVSYRNLLIWRGDKSPAPFSRDTRTIPPHDLTDQEILDAFPRGPGCDVLTALMEASEEVFAGHPVNRARVEAGQPPATHVWLWGLGRAPDLPSFLDKYRRSGTMITAVDLLRGLAALLGWRRLEVPGATGYLDTDYAAKGRAAIEALADSDIVCVHIEAPDEASHEGRVDAKIEALERIDSLIVAPLHAALRDRGEYRILVSPDHPTPVRTKTHSHGFVPFCVAGWEMNRRGDAAPAWDRGPHPGYHERAAAHSPYAFPAGWQLMRSFLDDPLDRWPTAIPGPLGHAAQVG
jgi:2,3-bisphosphoglycerate-independent phosphoglycerate mutase